MALLNYSTGIEAAKTVSQIQAILASHGAKSVLIDYGGDGTIEALSFKVLTPHGDIGIRLPVNPEPVLKILERQKELGKVRIRIDHAQAVRVAWRIVKDWVEAQMAILETEMVKMEQIFLPYIIGKDGKTLYEGLEERHFLLGEGKEAPDGIS